MENQNENLFEGQEQEAPKVETVEESQEVAQSDELQEVLNEQPQESLPVVGSNQGVSIFSNKENFEHSMRVAKMFSSSALVPQAYQSTNKNGMANCLIALELADRMGASPLMVMQNLYIVHGRPAWSSQFLIATLNQSGRFSPLRYEEDKNRQGGSIRAYAVDVTTGEPCYGAWVSMEMAKAEGWSTKKGSKWQTMPELMLRYRAAAFFTRQFAPEVSMGIHTHEEVIDITPIQEQKTAFNYGSRK